MNHREALDILAGHPHAWRFRQLCEDDSDPCRRDAYRELVIRLAGGEWPAYPSPAEQAAHLAASLWAWATAGFGMASDEEVARRRAICEACENYDAEQSRCRICGCYTAAKLRLKTEHCPLPQPKW